MEERYHFKMVLEEIRGKMTVIQSTHLASDVENVTDSLLIMSAGNLKAVMTPEELMCYPDGVKHSLEEGYLNYFRG